MPPPSRRRPRESGGFRPSRSAAFRRLRAPSARGRGLTDGNARDGNAGGTRGRQTALPAFQSAQAMFQPLRPLDGTTVLSPELVTSTTSPTIELLKNL